jgi:thiamine pyrophosphokinase
VTKALLLADGTPLPKALRDRLRRGHFTIAIDGAAELARQEGWQPDLITGDFDSIRPATLRFFEKLGVEILPTPDQDYTDLEKALAWCVYMDLRTIVVAQGTGTRLDHSLGNLSLLRRFHSPRREIIFYGETERVRYLENESITLKGRAGRRLSVIPFPEATVDSQGLAYEMEGLELALGVRESISNAAKKAQVKIQVKGRALIIEEYRKA